MYHSNRWSGTQLLTFKQRSIIKLHEGTSTYPPSLCFAPHISFVCSQPQGRDLAILAACNHTVLSYGTYGFWGGFLAGHGKGHRWLKNFGKDLRQRANSVRCIAQESFMSFSPVGGQKVAEQPNELAHLWKNLSRIEREKWTFLSPCSGRKAHWASGGDIEKEDYSFLRLQKSIFQ